MIQIFKQNWELGKLESFPILNVIYKHFSRNLQVKMKLLFEIETFTNFCINYMGSMYFQKKFVFLHRKCFNKQNRCNVIMGRKR